MNRSVSTDLPDLEAGTYSVLMKITAKRYNDLPRPEDTVRDFCRSNQEKLLRVGLAYDLAHARGQTWETEEERKEKAAREAKRKAMEKQKQREELREYKYKQWLIQKKQSDRNKKRKQKEDEYRRKRESRKATGIVKQPGDIASTNANTANQTGVEPIDTIAANAPDPENDVYADKGLPLRTNSVSFEQNVKTGNQIPQSTYPEPTEPNYSTRNLDMPSAQIATDRAERASQLPITDSTEPANLADTAAAGLERPPQAADEPSTSTAADPEATSNLSLAETKSTFPADAIAEQQAIFRPASIPTLPQPIPGPPVSKQQEPFSPAGGRAEDEQWTEEDRSRDYYPTPESNQAYDSQAQDEAPYDPRQAPESNAATPGDELPPNTGNANQYDDWDDDSVLPFDSDIDSDLDFAELPKTEEPLPPRRNDDDDEYDENTKFANDPWNAVCVVGLRVFSKDPGVEIKVVTPKTSDEWDFRLDLDDPSKGPSELI